MKHFWLFFGWFACLSLFLPDTMQAASGDGASLALAKTASLNTALVGDVFTLSIDGYECGIVRRSQPPQ